MPSPQKIKKTSSKDSSKIWLIIIIIILVIVIFGIGSILAGYFIYKAIVTPTPTPTIVQTPISIETPEPGFGQQDPSVYAQTALMAFMDSMIERDISGAMAWCSTNFQNSDYMQTLLAGTELFWESYTVGNPTKVGTDYLIPVTITTAASEMAGPAETFTANATMIEEAGLWVVDNLSFGE